MTNSELNYNSKEELINDFISLLRDQHKKRKAFITEFTAKHNIDSVLEFLKKFNRAKLIKARK